MKSQSVSWQLHFFNLASSRIRTEKSFAQFGAPLILACSNAATAQNRGRAWQARNYEQSIYVTRHSACD
jgi:hypothetical protein